MKQTVVVLFMILWSLFYLNSCTPRYTCLEAVEKCGGVCNANKDASKAIPTYLIVASLPPVCEDYLKADIPIYKIYYNSEWKDTLITAMRAYRTYTDYLEINKKQQADCIKALEELDAINLSTKIKFCKSLGYVYNTEKDVCTTN